MSSKPTISSRSPSRQKLLEAQEQAGMVDRPFYALWAKNKDAEASFSLPQLKSTMPPKSKGPEDSPSDKQHAIASNFDLATTSLESYFDSFTPLSIETSTRTADALGNTELFSPMNTQRGNMTSTLNTRRSFARKSSFSTTNNNLQSPGRPKTVPSFRMSTTTSALPSERRPSTSGGVGAGMRAPLTPSAARPRTVPSFLTEDFGSTSRGGGGTLVFNRMNRSIVRPGTSGGMSGISAAPEQQQFPDTEDMKPHVTQSMDLRHLFSNVRPTPKPTVTRPFSFDKKRGDRDTRVKSPRGGGVGGIDMSDLDATSCVSERESPRAVKHLTAASLIDWNFLTTETDPKTMVELAFNQASAQSRMMSSPPTGRSTKPGSGNANLLRNARKAMQLRIDLGGSNSAAGGLFSPSTTTSARTPGILRSTFTSPRTTTNNQKGGTLPPPGGMGGVGIGAGSIGIGITVTSPLSSDLSDFDRFIRSPKFSRTADSMAEQKERMAEKILRDQAIYHLERQQKYEDILRWFSMKPLQPPTYEETQGTGILEYFDACKQNNTNPITDFILQLKTKVMVLTGLQMGDLGVMAVCQGLKHNQHVQGLILADNGITVKGTDAIADLIQDLALTELDLSGNPIESGTLRLCRAAQKKHTLTSLLLRKCEIKDKFIAPVCDLLADSRSIITNIDLAYNGLGDAGFTALAEMIKFNITLLELDLSYNKPRKDGMVTFAQALIENRGLETLNLSWNGITKEAAELIGNALAEEGCALKTVVLAHCGIDTQGITAIAQGIEKNTRLEFIDLKSNKLGSDGARALFRALTVNRSVHKYDMRGCNLQDDKRTFFNDSNPTGVYELELDNPGDRAIAVRLQELEKQDFGLNWRNVYFNYQPFNEDPKTWPIPERGTLELVYKSGRSPPPGSRVLDPEDLEALIFQLSDTLMTDFDRLTLLRVAASIQHYTCEQCSQILRTFTDLARIRVQKISAFVSVFDRIVDKKQVFDVMKEFNGQELAEIKSKLGSVFGFSLDHPSGYYQLHLNVDYERFVAETLFSLSAEEPTGSIFGTMPAELSPPPPIGAEAEAGGGGGGEERNEKAEEELERFGVVSATLDKQPFRFDPAHGLPASGCLVIDYMSAKDHPSFQIQSPVFAIAAAKTHRSSSLVDDGDQSFRDEIVDINDVEEAT